MLNFRHETDGGFMLSSIIRPRPAVRRRVLRGREEHRHLLSSGVPGTNAAPRPLSLFRGRRSRRAGRVPTMPPMSPGTRPRSGPGRFQESCRPRHRRADRRWRDGRRWEPRTPGRGVRPQLASASPHRRRRVGRLARRTRPDAAALTRQAASYGNAASHHRSGLCERIRQRPPLQRPVPRPLPPDAEPAS